MERSDDAHCLLGMDGFVVLATSEEDGEWFVLVETTRNRMGCPSCGVIATGHGRSVVQVRDLPAGGRPVRLVWRKRRWICRDSECEKKSFTESHDLVEGSLTRRASVEICKRVGRDGHAVASVARDLGGFLGNRDGRGCPSRHPARRRPRALGRCSLPRRR
jgi:hypothetical protein